MIQKINQNYDWLFKQSYEEKDLKLNNFDGFSLVNIPHTNKETPINNFDEGISHIVSIYKKIIEIDEINHIYNLVFEGIGHYSKLYVNTSYVAEHKCGYTRFKADITKYLKPGKNEIVVIVDSREIYQPPFGFVIDYLCFGGMYRECYLELLNDNHFTDYYFHNDDKHFYVDCKVADSNANIKVLIKDNEKIIYDDTFKAKDKISGSINRFELWDINNPKLDRKSVV